MTEQTGQAGGSAFAGDVRDALREMGAAVVEMIAASTRAVSGRNASAARVVLARDSDVDWLDATIQDMCTLRMGRAASPGELRYLALALRMASGLERIADLAVRLSTYTLDLGRMPAGSLAPEILQAAESAQDTVRRAVAEFAGPHGAVGRSGASVCPVRIPASVTAEMMAEVTANPQLIRRVVLVQALTQCVEILHDHAVALAELAVGLRAGDTA